MSLVVFVVLVADAMQCHLPWSMGARVRARVFVRVSAVIRCDSCKRGSQTPWVYHTSLHARGWFHRDHRTRRSAICF